MKRIFLSVILVLSANTMCAVSQEMDTIEQLRHQIRELEKIDRDEHISFEIRKLNAGFLDERRAALKKTLETRIASAREYLLRVGSQLNSREILTIEQNLVAWQKELEQPSGPAFTPPATADSESVPQPALVSSPAPASVVPASFTAAAAPQSENQPIQSKPILLTKEGADYIRQPVAEIMNPRDARNLIEEAFNAGAFTTATGKPIPKPANIDDKDFHCVIHVMRWSDLAPTPGATNSNQTVAAQNWYVYNNGKAKGFRSDRIWSLEDFTGDRIYGVKKIWLLYVHLNKAPGVEYTAYYDFQFTKKTPTNISNLLALAQVFASFTAEDIKTPTNVWGGSFVETNYLPSDATVTAKVTKNTTTGPYVALDKPKKFDNEGLYWWDVSVGVPIRRIKELQFDTTNNTVTQKEVDKQNAFALLNLYFPPKDLKGTSASWIPHFVGGVAIAKQPLKKFMFGAGFGPHFTNFYVGALFTEEKKPATLAEGSTATPDQLNNDLRKHFKTQFTFGINVPVRAVLSTLDKKK